MNSAISASCLRAAVLLLCSRSVGVAADPLPEILVTGRRPPPPVPEVPAPESARDAADLARIQPDTVFDVVKDIPGVSVNGGPRSSGMKFNIRGFSNTEDVIVEVDGIPRSFEKYRFGSGVFIEPELLSRLTVERSPSITRGSGALGGSVSARTRDAAELLGADERFGFLAKTGYATNNDEVAYTASAFGEALPGLGLLGSFSLRDSNDLRLPDGSRLEHSETDSESYLLKSSWELLSGGILRLGYTAFEDSGLEPYDATGGQPGFFGTVERAVDDGTIVVQWEQQGESPWLNLGVTAGQVRTRMEDLLRPGETPFSNPNTGNVVDEYDYETWVFRADNLASLPYWEEALSIQSGVQFLDNERDITRVTENQAINDALYPGGFNAAQPPGSKRSLGIYLQPTLAISVLEFRTGLRWDRYVTEAKGGTEAQLEALGEETRITAERLTPALGMSWHVLPDRLTAFYDYTEAFRPPLIDEYFTQGAFGRCIPAYLGDLAPPSRVCGSLYVPEESRTRETGLLWYGTGPFGSAWQFRGSYFRSDVTHALESITAVTPDTVGQPGREQRHGVEFELSADVEHWFGRAGYSQIRGNYTQPGQSGSLYDLPGDTTTLTLGTRWFGGNIELGYRLEDVQSRRAVVGTQGTTPVIGIQQGYRLHGAFASWAVSEAMELRLAGENLTNASYQLNDGFGGAPGTEAPGRNVRLSVLVRPAW